jgi:hypothetical protein
MNAAQHTHLRLVRSQKATKLAYYKSVQSFLQLHKEYTLLQTAMKENMMDGKPMSMPDLVGSMERANGILREMVALKEEMDSQ